MLNQLSKSPLLWLSWQVYKYASIVYHKKVTELVYVAVAL
jgi:hypothetical protein